MVFAEGGITNNTGIIKFKKGPFYAERTIEPVFMKFDPNAFSPAYNMPVIPLILMQLSRGFIMIDINKMPPFQPNEYLFETHKNSEGHEDRENERWETFAWAVRDAMITVGGFSTETYTMRENMVYEKYMNGSS